MLRDSAQPVAADIDLLYASAGTQAAMVRGGRLSSEALVTLAIQRAKDTATAINCIAVPRYERALDEARAVDVALARGEDPGPLGGVPVTVKDGIATAGDRQTLGSLSMRDVVAERDDLVWARLKAAGAILIGKTATPEFYHEVTTHSAIPGPWIIRPAVRAVARQLLWRRESARSPSARTGADRCGAQRPAPALWH